MAELADAADLKSAAARLVGSSPSPGTSEVTYLVLQYYLVLNQA